MAIAIKAPEKELVIVDTDIDDAVLSSPACRETADLRRWLVVRTTIVPRNPGSRLD